jgi:hypothetical protein
VTLLDISFHDFTIDSAKSVGAFAGAADRLQARNINVKGASIKTNTNYGGAVVGTVRNAIFAHVRVESVSVLGMESGGGFGAVVGDGNEVSLSDIASVGNTVQGFYGVGGIIGNVTNFESQTIARLTVSNVQLRGAGGIGGGIGQIMADVNPGGQVVKTTPQTVTDVAVSDLRIGRHPLSDAANSAGGIAGIVWNFAVVSGQVDGLTMSGVSGSKGSVVGLGHSGSVGTAAVSGATLAKLGAILKTP